MTTSAAEGSQTAVILTEHTLSTITAAGKYTLYVNSVNQVAGDTLFLRIYLKVRSTGASTLAYEACFEGAQTQIILISEDVDSTNEIRYTLEQTTGTGRVYEWEVMQKTDADNAGITANGAAIASLNDFDPATDAVANVTLVATTTTNTDQRGTDSALLASSAPANFSALGINASGHVSRVTLTDTSTANTDMRGTDSAATAANLAIVDTNVDTILVDTSTTIPGQISGLNDIAATDIVSAGAITTLAGAVVNVDLVDVTTTNSDMRGTDSAATAANLAIVDTNVDAILVDTGTTIPSQISGLNDIAATDIVTSGAITTLAGAVVNVDLVDTTTTNTDMRGTNSAFLAASAPTNFSSLVISGAGAADTLIQGYLNTLIAETTAGNIANNFDTFYDNANAITTVVIDDISSAGGTDWSASERNEIRGRLGVTGTTAAGGNTPTLSLEATLALRATQASVDVIDSNVDAILVDTSTTIPGQITGLNDIAATDIVSAGAITTLSGAVVNVDLVDTTTTNTDMRGTDSAATAANLAIVDTNVDSILVDTGTTIPGQISGLNDIAATDIVSAGAITTLLGAVVNVDLVDTTTTNTDMRGTDSAATASALAVVDANVDAILVDTSTTIPGQISGLNDIAATDIVSAGAITTLAGAVVNVDLVDTTTTNTDMRGTDSALLASSAPSNFSALGINASGHISRVTLVDTTTANSDMRGTDSAATASALAIVDTNVDAILVDTGTTMPASLAVIDVNVDAVLVDTSATIPGQISGLNDIAATDIVTSGAIATLAGSVVNVDLVDVTTTNTDMRGTDGANTTTPPTAATITDAVWDELQSGHTTAGTFGNFLDAQVSGAGASLTQQQVRDSMKLAATAGAPAAGSIDQHLDDIETDTGTNIPGQITGLNDFDPATDTVANVTLVDTVTTNTDMRGTDNAATATNLAIVDSNVDAILVDTSTTIPATLATLATSSALATVDANVDAILVDTGTTIPAQISALNDFNPAIDTVASVTLVATTTTNSDMRGTDSALLAASAPANFSALGINVSGHISRVTLVDTTTANTDMRGTDGANTTAPDNAGITANGVAIAALNDLSPAQVNAEVLDVLTVDTFSEPSAVPLATDTILAKLNWIATLNRNKITQTATLQAVRNDGDTGNIATATVSDDTVTTTREEYT